MQTRPTSDTRANDQKPLPAGWRATELLGYAGLVPFVATALVVWLARDDDAMWTSAANAYAFAIICFLCGSWWGLALRIDSPRLLYLSNGYFLIAFFVFLLVPDWWALAAAMLLIGLYFAEQNTALFPPLADRYRRLRKILTTVAGACMLAIYLAD